MNIDYPKNPFSIEFFLVENFVSRKIVIVNFIFNYKMLFSLGCFDEIGDILLHGYSLE